MSRRTDESIEVLVADDDARFRSIVSAILVAETDLVVVAEAADGAEALAKATTLVPDVVLLDVAMPGTGGIATARAINERVPTTKVVMLTASDDEDDLFEALRAGASGYLLKDRALIDVGASVRAATTGDVVLAPSMATKLVAEFIRPLPKAISGLSERELQILQLAADGHSNRHIADGVALSPHTVKRHMANILAKLHQRTRLEAVLYAQRHDLLD